MKYTILIILLLTLIYGCKNSEQEFTELKIIQTSRAGDQLTAKGSVELVSSATEKRPGIRINPRQKFQKILGFGGAFTESSAYVLNQLSPQKRQQVIHSYFSKEGADYSLTRTHINSCDFSLSSYSYAPDSGDINLENFSVKEDMDDLIPLIREARAASIDGFKIVASPWTAPPWMKDNNGWFGGSLKPEYYKTWALYFSKYIKAYAEQGIDIWGITVENEPLGNNASWESMHFTPQTMAVFLKEYLIPQFKDDSLDTEILIYDQNRDHVKEWVEYILRDHFIAENVWGTAVHWYSSTIDWHPEILNDIHKNYPQKHIIHSEGCIDNDVPVWQDDDWYWRKEATDWGFIWATGKEKLQHPEYVPVYRYARDIIGGLNSWLEGWIDWNIVLNTQGGPNHVKNWCVAPVIAKPETDEIYYTPLFYILNHFSKYIRPGAQRIGVENGIKELMVTGCVNPDATIVVEILNQTEQERDYNLTVGNKTATIQIAASALQTLIIK